MSIPKLVGLIGPRRINSLEVSLSSSVTTIASLCTLVHCACGVRPLTESHSIVSQLASLLDLNALHDLSRTCRQFRANLLQYRTMLKMLTLRCVNENPESSEGAGIARYESGDLNIYHAKHASRRITSGKVGPCARDMVGECRKCSKIVCRV